MILQPKTKEAYRLLHDGILTFARAEMQGFRVDAKYLRKRDRQLTHKIKKLQEQFYKEKMYKLWERHYRTKTNINSKDQLRNVLYKLMKINPVKETDKGNPSTDEESLKELNISALNKLIRIGKLRTLRDRYLSQFLREEIDGYIHPTFHLNTVRTYRSSSSNPNFQNIPKRDKEAMSIIRSGIFPRPGHQLLEIDYGALEVAIAACYHKDPTMVRYIKNPEGDLHTDMTKQIFKLDSFTKKEPTQSYLRSSVKNSFVFPQFYGDYYKNNADGFYRWLELPKQGRWKSGQGVQLNQGTISDHLISKGIKSPTQFTNHLKKIEDHFWSIRFPEYTRWKESHWKIYKRYGYFTMKTGFTCQGVMSRNDAINYPVQGSAFHCLLWSFIKLDEIMRKEKWRTRLIGQIHDSIILDVHPEELRHVAQTIKWVTTKALPEAWEWIIVPLTIDAELCDVDQSWATKQDWEIPDY